LPIFSFLLFSVSSASLCPLRKCFFRVFSFSSACRCFSLWLLQPDGANRGHYRNARIDALTDQIRMEMNQEKRKALYSEVQKILAEDLPYLPLWFNDVVSVYRRSLGVLDLPSTGNYNFLVTLHLNDR